MGAHAFSPSGALKRSLDFHWWGQIHAPWDLYLKPRRALSGLPLNALGHLIVPELIPVRPKGSVVLADLVTGNGGKPLLPAALAHRWGKGRVCFVPGAIEKTYASNDRDLGLARLLGALVRRVSRKPAPYQVDEARGLFLHATEKPGHRFLHLVDENLDRKEHRATIRLRLDGNKPVAIRSLVSGKALRWKQSGEYAVMSEHRFSRHECVMMEY
jgi:hypothetical protein